jgi:hypothetical protein
MSALAEQLRRKLSGWRAAEERGRAERRNSRLTAAESLAAAEEVRALNPAAFEGADPVREREVAEARRAWARVRERWRRSAAH